MAQAAVTPSRLLEVEDVRIPTAWAARARLCSTASMSPSTRARSSRCSAGRARASRPCCASSPACSRPPAGGAVRRATP